MYVRRRREKEDMNMKSEWTVRPLWRIKVANKNPERKGIAITKCMCTVCVIGRI